MAERLVGCPYCGAVLDPPPARSKKCPECGEGIVVRTDRASGQKVMLTSDDADLFDIARAAEVARNKAMKRIQAMGLDEPDYERTAAKLTEQWGRQPSPGDVYWAIANEQVVLLGDPREHGYDLQQVYWGMASHLRDEGRPHERVQRQAHEARLRWEQENLAQVFGTEAAMWRTVILADACCKACKALDGRSYTFEQAIEMMPLPAEDCTRGWCNCTWSNVPPD